MMTARKLETKKGKLYINY